MGKKWIFERKHVGLQEKKEKPHPALMTNFHWINSSFVGARSLSPTFGGLFSSFFLVLFELFTTAAILQGQMSKYFSVGEMGEKKRRRIYTNPSSSSFLRATNSTPSSSFFLRQGGVQQPLSSLILSCEPQKKYKKIKLYLKSAFCAS